MRVGVGWKGWGYKCKQQLSSLPVFILLFCFETGPHIAGWPPTYYVADLELLTLLPLPP